MTNDYCQILLYPPRLIVSQIYEAIYMLLSGGDKIVSVGKANKAKVNKDKKTRRIRVKKERKKRTKT